MTLEPLKNYSKKDLKALQMAIDIIQASDERLLTTDQAAEFMQVENNTIHRWRKQGKLIDRAKHGDPRYRKIDLLILK